VARYTQIRRHYGSPSCCGPLFFLGPTQVLQYRVIVEMEVVVRFNAHTPAVTQKALLLELIWRTAHTLAVATGARRIGLRRQSFARSGCFSQDLVSKLKSLSTMHARGNLALSHTLSTRHLLTSSPSRRSSFKISLLFSYDEHKTI